MKVFKKLDRFWKVFVYSTRKLLANSQVKFSIEKRDFGNLPYFNGHYLRLAEKLLIFEFLLFCRNFLRKYLINLRWKFPSKEAVARIFPAEVAAPKFFCKRKARFLRKFLNL